VGKIFSKQELQQKYESWKTTKHDGYRSGIDCLDEIIRFDKKTINIITAVAGAGKSTFLNYYAAMMWKTNGFKTLFISLEMDANRLLSQMLYYNTLDDALDVYQYADNSTLNTIDDVIEVIKQTDSDIVVVDPFNLLPINKDINTNVIGDVLRRLKDAALQNDVILILVAHPSKNLTFLTDDDYPSGLDINGSVNFNNMADSVVGMRRQDNNNVLFGVAKLRNNIEQGQQGGTCILHFNYNDKSFGQTKTNNDDKIYDMKYYKKDSLKNEAFQAIKNEYKVSYYNNCKDTLNSKEIALKDILNNNLTGDVKQKIDEIRNIDSIDEIKSLKQSLPAFTPAGTFTAREKVGINHYNNLVSIDIDAKDNSSISTHQMKDIILNSKLRQYIYYIGNSCSNKGVWGLIKISGDKDDFSGHFKALEKDFKEIGLVIDNSCKDICRLRFVSYDLERYLNEDSKIYQKSINAPYISNNAQITTYTKDTAKDMQTVLNIVEDIERKHLNIVETHMDSVNVINALVNNFDEDGLPLWLRIRQQKSGYNENTATKKYRYQMTSDTQKKYVENANIGVIISKYNRALENK
jgi:KaiC/GvpD/RAD55 family RecA-like ATPase